MAEGDEQPQGVMVRPVGGGRLEQHPTGHTFEMYEGHLFVRGKSTRDIAVYAPGTWAAAKLGDSERWDGAEQTAAA